MRRLVPLVAFESQWVRWQIVARAVGRDSWSGNCALSAMVDIQNICCNARTTRFIGRVAGERTSVTDGKSCVTLGQSSSPAAGHHNKSGHINGVQAFQQQLISHLGLRIEGREEENMNQA